jgi:hypothetical protein
LPASKLEQAFATGADGEVVFSFRLTQSKVSDDFRMQVPIYFELAHGNLVFVGCARLAGDSSVEQKVSMKGLKAKPRRAAQLLRRRFGLAQPDKSETGARGVLPLA